MANPVLLTEVQCNAFSNGGTAGNAGGTGYCGFSLRETAGSSALVRIRDSGISGNILDEIPMGANEGVSDYYGVIPLMSTGLVYMELALGSVEGSIRWR